MPQTGPRKVASPTMVGRDLELNHIRSALEAAMAGRPQVIVVGGEAGIGKSRLVSEAARHAREAGARVLQGGCLAMGSGIPYLPFLEILRSLLREERPESLESLLGPARAQLALIVPELSPRRAGSSARGLLAHGPGATMADAAATAGPIGEMASGLARLQLFDGLLRAAARLGESQPTVVIVEDVQWADEASLALLAFLVHSLRDERLLLLLTVRTAEIGGPALAFLSDIERSDSVERLELGALAADATRRQVAAILDRDPDRALVVQVHELSGGNPFFVEELLALGSGEPEPTVAWSQRLRDILRARLARLPDDVVEVLRVASAAGRTVDELLLADATGLELQRVEQAVRIALAEQVLVPAQVGLGGGYRFRHELLRAYVADGLLPSESARLHARFARALVTHAAETDVPGELAFHWDAAGDSARAFTAHVEAGLAAVAAFAFEDAQRHLVRALELWDLVPSADDRIGLDRPRLMQAAADAAAQAGDLDSAIKLARSVIQGGQADPELLAYVRSGLRWYLWRAGRADEAIAEAREAVRELGDGGDPHWRANALGHYAGLLMQTRRIALARRTALQAVAAAEQAGAWEEAALAQGVIGWCLVFEGRFDEGVGIIARVRDAARSTTAAHLSGAALAETQLVAALEYVGRPVEASAMATGAIEWASAHGMARTVGATLAAAQARCLYLSGHWREAAAVVDPALASAPIGPGWLDLLVTRALLAVAQSAAGGASGAVRAAATVAGSMPDHGSRGWLDAARAEAYLWDNDAARALDALGEGLGLSDAGTVGPIGRADAAPADSSLPRRLALAAWAAADLSVRDHASGRSSDATTRALDGVRSALRRFGRHRALTQAWRADLAAAHADLGRAATRTGEHRVAGWRHAAEAAAGTRPYLEAYARWRLAEALVGASGGREAATTELRLAAEVASAIDAGRLATEIESLARRARLAVGPPAPAVATPTEDAAPFGLTEREREVLELLAEGLSNPEIGARLYISPRTASVHVSNILGKLGVSGRVEAATMAHRLGLVASAGAGHVGAEAKGSSVDRPIEAAGHKPPR